MIKVYIGKLFDYAYLPVLYPNLGFQKKEKNLFISKAFEKFTEPIFGLVERPDMADFFLFPHDYFLFPNQQKQVYPLVKLSRQHHKKIIIFGHGDPDQEIPIPNSIVFRTSQYRYKKKPNEIIMPAYVEDLADIKPVSWKEKGNKPIVSFCGWASFKNQRQEFVFRVKQLVLDLKNLLSGKNPIVHRRGLWFRQEALKILSRSPFVETNFILRNRFSGHQATIGLSPEKNRDEYIENILDSDFVLAVKGYGNFSLRFYEALSLGKIPLFLDTDCVLPLEDIINYHDFVVFVDYRDIRQIDKILADFYKNLTEDKFMEMQKKARETFERYLRIDAFFALIPEILKKTQ